MVKPCPCTSMKKLPVASAVQGEAEILIPFSLSPNNDLVKTMSKHLVLFFKWDCKTPMGCVPMCHVGITRLRQKMQF